MSGDEGKHKPWGKWLAFVAIGLITISLISFTNSMDDIENLVDPEQNHTAMIEPNANKIIKLQNNRIYTMLRVVDNISNEAEVDLEITDSENNQIRINEPTWMQPQRTGSSGKIIYDPIGTITLVDSGDFNFKNSNSTSTVYIVDDQSVDLQAFQQPGIFIAFISCCFGLMILPLSLIIHLFMNKKRGDEKVVLQRMPTNRIPTTEELFFIQEGKMDPQNVKGFQHTQSIPPPFTNMKQKSPEEKISKNQPLKVEKKVDLDNDDDNDWQSWDTG